MLLKIKSNTAKNIATAKVIPITTKVWLVVCFFVGQVTFLTSSIASFKYFVKAFAIRKLSFQKRPLWPLCDEYSICRKYVKTVT